MTTSIVAQPRVGWKKSIQRDRSGSRQEWKESGVRKRYAASQAGQVWKTLVRCRTVNIMGNSIIE